MKMNYRNILTNYHAQVFEAANQADAMLLITGNTGTGKSHLAELVHVNSRRRNSKLTKINLATLSENLMESELFGHEKGAFTGADVRRIGKLELSNGGTVFLDEIGELSPRLQTKLLDFIQYKKITPVGGNREVELNVRVLAATNKNLDESVAKGEFRSDLFHRLNVFHIEMPDLKNSTEKIMEHIQKIITEKSLEMGKSVIGISDDVQRALLNYDWPGNIRELHNVIEFAVAMTKDSKIEMTALPKRFSEFMNLDELNSGESMPFEEEKSFDYHYSKEKFEKSFITNALQFCGGQINLTSRTTGLNKVSLTEKIKKYEIDWKKMKQSQGNSDESTSDADVSVMQY